MADSEDYTSAMYYADARICIRQILNAKIGINEDQFNHYYSFAKEEARQILGSGGDADVVEYTTLAWTWMYFLGRPCSGGFPIHNPALPPVPEIPKVISRSTSTSSITTEEQAESIKYTVEKSAEPLTPTTPFSESTNDSQHIKPIESPVENQEFKLVIPQHKNNKKEHIPLISATARMSSKMPNTTNRFSVLDASEYMFDIDASDEAYGGNGKAATTAEGKTKRKRAKKAKKNKETAAAVDPEAEGEKLASSAETPADEIESREDEKVEEFSNEILETYDSFDSEIFKTIIQDIAYSKKICFFLGFGAGIVFGGALVFALNL